MIIFLYGPDTYSSRQKSNQIIEKYKAKHKTGLNFRRLSLLEDSLSNLKDAVDVVSMFSEKKLIILEDVFEADGEKQEDLLVFLKDKNLIENQDVFLLIYQAEQPKTKNKLFNFLIEKANQLEEFKLLEGTKLENWIKKEVTNRDGKIEPKAIKKLAVNVGHDLWQMVNEIDKLISYKGNKVIREEDVGILVKPKIDTNIFVTIDALARRDKRTAFKLLHQHLERRDDEIYLLSMFIYQFRNLLKIKDLVEKGVPFYQLVKRTGLHPFVIKKSWEQIKKFSLKELKKIYQKLLFLDLEIKIGRIEPETALDVFLMEI